MKTKIFFRLSSLSASLVFLAALAQPTAAADWPQYRGPKLDGSSPEKVAAWSGPVKEVWKVPTTAGFSSFTVSGGKAFTVVGREVEGAPQEVCIALDEKNGKELWATPVGIAKYNHDGGNDGTPDNRGGDGPRSTPSISGDKVYVISADLALFCLNAADGKVVWKKDVIKEHAGRNISWKNAASPLIDGDLIFMAGGGPGQSLLGIDKKSGKTVWKTEDALMTHATPVRADIHGVPQVIFFTQKGLVSVKTKDGSLLWHHPFPFKISTAASPIVSGDIVYCSAGYGVGAGACKITKQGDNFQATELWRKPNALPNHWSTPVLHDGHLYGMFSFKEYGKGPLKCVEIATGKEVWSQPGFGAGNVILVGDNVLALSDAGELVLVSATPKAYTELSRAKILQGKCWSTPSISNGKVFARSTREGVCVQVPSQVSRN